MKRFLLPNDLGEVMTESDCAKAWEYLESTLHISKLWRKDFEKKFLRQSRSITKPEFFIRYTREHIDPPLLALLQRKESPVQSLLRFLLKDRLNEKKAKGTRTGITINPAITRRIEVSFVENFGWSDPAYSQIV